jgi:hypothetical protein
VVLVRKVDRSKDPGQMINERSRTQAALVRKKAYTFHAGLR